MSDSESTTGSADYVALTSPSTIKEDLKRQLATANHDKDASLTQVAELEKQLTSANHDKDAATAKTADLEQQLAAALDDKAAAVRERNIANTNKERATTHGTELQQQLDAANGDKAAALTRASTLQADLDASNLDLRNTAKEVAALQTRLDTAARELRDAQLESTQLAEGLADAVKTTAAERDGAKKKLQVALMELRKTTEALKISNEALDVADRELKREREEAKGARAANEELKDECEKLALDIAMQRSESRKAVRKAEGEAKCARKERDVVVAKLEVAEAMKGLALKKQGLAEKMQEMAEAESRRVGEEVEYDGERLKVLKEDLEILKTKLHVEEIGEQTKKKQRETRERRIKEEIAAALREEQGNQLGFLQALSLNEIQDIEQSIAEGKLVKGVDPVKVLAGMYVALKRSYGTAWLAKDELMLMEADLRRGPDAEAWKKGLGDDMKKLYERIGLTEDVKKYSEDEEKGEEHKGEQVQCTF